MSQTRWLVYSGAALALVLATLITTVKRHRPLPPLPAMKGSCATGLGTLALCSEWSGALSYGQRSCAVQRGTWNESPCAKSSAGGTCIVPRGEGIQVIHYGSAWSSQGRAKQNCSAQHGELY